MKTRARKSVFEIVIRSEVIKLMGTERTMRKLIDGFLIGFGSAMSIIIFSAWQLLWQVLDSGNLIVKEADVITASQIATSVGTILGVLLVVAGLCMGLLGRKKMGE